MISQQLYKINRQIDMFVIDSYINDLPKDFTVSGKYAVLTNAHIRLLVVFAKNYSWYSRIEFLNGMPIICFTDSVDDGDLKAKRYIYLKDLLKFELKALK